MNGSLLIRPLLAKVLGILLSWFPSDGRTQAPEDLHTFTSADGKSLMAEVIDFRDAKVFIRRVSDGLTFELEANRLSPPDVAFMRDWLKNKEAAAHPSGWTPLRVHLPQFADKVEAPGIPEAFRRIDSTTWEAELPADAWILVKIWTANEGADAPLEFLLPYSGERDWHLVMEEARLIRKTSPTDQGVLAGIHVRAGDDEATLREWRAALPDGGVALYSDFLDGADLKALGVGGVNSLVCAKIEDLSAVAEAKVRAVRVTGALSGFDGFSECQQLEHLDLRHSGAFPLSDAGRLENLSTLLASGEMVLASATGASNWPALKHLSLAGAEIADPPALGAFLAGLPALRSLTLPDLQEMEVSGIARCPELTVLNLGDACHDPGAAGVAALKKLSVALLNDQYGTDELAALAQSGHFGRIRAFQSGVSVDFSKLPQLKTLLMTGDQDGFDMAALRGIGRPFALDTSRISESDLARLAAVAPDLRITSLNLRSPNVTTLDSLPDLPGLAFLKVENQLVTFDQKMVSLELGSRFSGLRGLEINRMQNLESLSVASAALSDVFVVFCDALATIVLPAPDKVRLRAVNCPQWERAANP